MRTKVKAAVAEVAALEAESVPLKETGHSVPSRRSTIHEKDANLSGPICMIDAPPSLSAQVYSSSLSPIRIRSFTL